MFVGVLRLSLRVPGARSLKDKRRVVRSYKDRLTSRLCVSVAEVGALDDWQRAVLGVAVCAREAVRCDQLLAAAARLADDVRDAVLEDRATEILSFGDAGQGVRGEFGLEGALDPGGAGLGDEEEP
ncbi:MAG: DUF503 domain-containing protein [Myxococcales bacterium]|nr:DUF503 domain-containing protein [Myxococcales bacterium]